MALHMLFFLSLKQFSIFFSFWLTSISLASSFPGSTQRLAQARLGIPPSASYIYLGIPNSIIAHITHSVLTVDYLPISPTRL